MELVINATDRLEIDELFRRVLRQYDVGRLTSNIYAELYRILGTYCGAAGRRLINQDFPDSLPFE